MKEFIVSINRTAYSNREFIIGAESQKEAEDKALEMAGDYEFSEHDADYHIEFTAEKK